MFVKTLQQAEEFAGGLEGHNHAASEIGDEQLTAIRAKVSGTIAMPRGELISRSLPPAAMPVTRR